MSKEEEIGTLIVVVLKAQNLKDIHFYKQDVYARVTFNGVTKRTKVDVKGGQHPLWDEEIRFPVMKNSAPKYRQLEASCWAKEHKDEDDVLLGEGKVDTMDTLKTGEFDEWVPLSVNGVQRGDIYLEITYYSNGPAPVNLAPAQPLNLQRRPSKLKPAERMYRPPQAVTPPRKNDALPPIPEPGPAAGPVPSTLLPGPKRPSPQSSPHPHSQNLPYPGHRPSQSQNLPYPGDRPSQSQNLPYPGDRPSQSQNLPYPGDRTSQSQNLPFPSDKPQQAAPAALPAILRPGPSTRPPASAAHHASHTSDAAAYPYTPPSGSAQYNLTPGAGAPSIPNPHTRTSSSYASAAPPQSSSTAPGYSSIPNIPTPTSPPPSNPLWSGNQNHEESVSFSFPVPNLPAGPPVPPTSYDYGSRHTPPSPPASYNYSSSQYQPPYQSSYSPAPPSHRRTSSFPTKPSNSTNDLPDPYLIARYQSPLPLPPGAEPVPTHTPTPKPQPQPHSHHHHHENTSTLSIPQPAPAPTVRSKTPIDESRLRQLRQAEEEAARRREQEERDAELARQIDQEELERERSSTISHAPPPPPRKTPSPAPVNAAEKARLQVLKEREEEERRRREQEEKDLELARQLDRELNLAALAGGPARSDSAPHVPGGF